MRIEFEKELLKLYTSGKSKKINLPQNLITRFLLCVSYLEAAELITDLWSIPSLNFEKLKGTKNRYSVRINNVYRLEMEIDWENEEKTKGIIYLKEISKHYGD